VLIPSDSKSRERPPPRFADRLPSQLATRLPGGLVRGASGETLPDLLDFAPHALPAARCPGC